MSRTNWYTDHPVTCTCAQCTSKASGARRVRDERDGMGKVGRNEPCPCGSGRKFKRCHGA